MIVGDINLDQLNWEHPDRNISQMVDMTKGTVEQQGFQQLVEEHTRSWNGQHDTLIDHVWTNCQQRIIKVFNHPRGVADHHVIGVDIRVRGVVRNSNEFWKRNWKKFSQDGILQNG